MKRKVLVVSLVVVVATALSSFAGTIVGSKHDFSSETWSANRICLPCHTAHNSMTTVDGPLWNHEMSTATYTMYSGVPNQPGTASKLCLSCHDGTVALDSYGGASGSTMLTGDANLGTDLSNDHPIAVLYPADGTDFVVDPTPSGINLYNEGVEDRVECGSCHNPHDNQYTYFLNVQITGSQLCLACHIK